MIANIQQLVESFEKGGLTRRELIGALSALLFMPRQVSSAEALVPASTLNHVTLSVSDRARSKKFYEEMFGFTLAAAHANGDNMTVGKSQSFVGIYQAGAGRTPGIGHICLGVEKFDADATQKLLDARGLKTRMSVLEKDAAGRPVKQLSFLDPDNISVQLADVSYVG